MLKQEIFKSYDIRGIVGKTLTTPVVYAIGRALGSALKQRSLSDITIGRDGRLSGPELVQALIDGLRDENITVNYIGMVTTGMLYYAAWEYTDGSGVMVTGSHNPPEYNGLKMMLGGETLYGDAIQSLYQTLSSTPLPQFPSSSNNLSYPENNIQHSYQNKIVSDIHLSRPLKIAIDCGNGVAGAYAGNLFRALGCEVRELFCEVDGHFPNHHPDPSQAKNLQDLITVLKEGNFDLGLAFDGDGDRLGVVTPAGIIIDPDRQLMLYAVDLLKRQPGASIIYDVKCSRLLPLWIKQYGGVPIMSQTGHSLVKAKMKTTGALLAGEMSGHIFFKERWYGFDDALYVAARLLEILSVAEHPSSVLESLPQSPCSTPELQILCQEGENFRIIHTIKEWVRGATPSMGGYFAQHVIPHHIIDIDGLRVEYSDGFGLVRASNTTPVLVLRFEADNPDAMQRIQDEFRKVLQTAKPGITLPF